MKRWAASLGFPGAFRVALFCMGFGDGEGTIRRFFFISGLDPRAAGGRSRHETVSCRIKVEGFGPDCTRSSERSTGGLIWVGRQVAQQCSPRFRHPGICETICRSSRKLCAASKASRECGVYLPPWSHHALQDRQSCCVISHGSADPRTVRNPDCIVAGSATLGSCQHGRFRPAHGFEIERSESLFRNR